MYKTVLILPDGTQLSSGVGESAPIVHFQLTQWANDPQELTFGAVCADMMEVRLLMKNEDVPVHAGDEIQVYRQDETGVSHAMGIFLAEKPTRLSANILRLTAYDRVSLLDRELGPWLESLQQWPYPLQDFAQMVCDACGVPFAQNQTIPNGQYPVSKPALQQATGRQLMRWIAQAAGCFCRANPQGALELSWYTRYPKRLFAQSQRQNTVYDGAGNLCIDCDDIQGGYGENGALTLQCEGVESTYDGQGNLHLQIPAVSPVLYYYQNGFSREEYRVLPIDGIQIRGTQTDVGTCYPETEKSNVYVIEGNPLLTAYNAQSLIGVAQTLYERLQPVQYTPCKLRLPGNADIHPGHILQVYDIQGRQFTAYVMKKTQSGQVDTLECTGSECRNSTTAVNLTDTRQLAGRVLNLQATIDGIRAENLDADGRMSKLAMDLNGIRAEVSRQEQDFGVAKEKISALEQGAQQLSLRFQTISDSGVQKVRTETGFCFDENGLSIQKSGTQMENLLDERGMYVKRSGEVVLQADQDGVTATDVTVHNYLILGGHARFEAYGDYAQEDRTACFWI